MRVTRIPLDSILREPTRFNSSNHPTAQGGQPEDYRDVIARCDARHWIHAFHPGHTSVTIPRKEVGWLWDALAIGSLRKRIPKQYEDEIEELAKAIEPSFPPGPPRFVRTDRTSLKTGVHGAGPYHTAKQVVESMVTCRLGHHPFERTDETITLYIMPWLELDKDKEFRVFVHAGRVTAISQQFIYQSNAWLTRMDETGVGHVADTIVSFVERSVVPKLRPTLDSFVLDLVAVGDDATFHPIEINPFGAEYTSGSACFHWLEDADVLCGRSEPELRFVMP